MKHPSTWTERLWCWLFHRPYHFWHYMSVGKWRCCYKCRCTKWVAD